MLPRFAYSLLASLFVAASLSAQKLEVPLKLSVGESIKIGYTNPAKANGVVFIEIRDPDNPANIEILEIHLDKTGAGSIEFLVPDWDQAYFHAPDGAQESRVIV